MLLSFIIFCMPGPDTIYMHGALFRTEGKQILLIFAMHQIKSRVNTVLYWCKRYWCCFAPLFGK